MDFRQELNPHQYDVVTHLDGPMLVLAGAGSGKTRCIIFRTAWLLRNEQIKPWNLLIVTFTNKAANELRKRLETMIHVDSRSVWVGTFHSICTRILRSEADSLPWDKNFVIYDADDQRSLIKRCMKDLDIDSARLPHGTVADLISKSKGNLIEVERFGEFHGRGPMTDRVAKVYERYQETLLKNNAMDFDDLLLQTAKLLYEKEDIRDRYAEKFRYVMIDEYQDTNYAQFRIVNLIAGKHQNLCVVGDDDQAIYSWRGANIKNILNFHADYKDVKTFRLEQNYRSTQGILDAANSLIAKNHSRHHKMLWTENGAGTQPMLSVYEDEQREAEGVTQDIRDLLGKEQTDPEDIVILYRVNAQSRVFEQHFIRAGIPYRIVGGVDFFRRKEVKDVIAYLRIIQNPQDSESLARVVNFPPRQIGNTTIERCLDHALLEGSSLWSSLINVRQVQGLGPAARASIGKFTDMVERWRGLQGHVSDLIRQVLGDTGLAAMYEQSSDLQDQTRFENLQEFVEAAIDFSEEFFEDHQIEPTLADFLQNIALQTDLDTQTQDTGKVNLMTMHNAKGLEFRHVFVVGLNEGLIPHRLSIENDETLEEERRLLYVAMTRSQENLQLSYSRWRREYNSLVPALPSRFLKDIDPEKIRMKHGQLYDTGMYHPTPRPKKTVTYESEKFFRIGDAIEHSEMGRGMVLNVDGTGNDAKLTVSFVRGKLVKVMGSSVKIVESK